MTQGLMPLFREAMAARSIDAQSAYALFVTYCGHTKPIRVPGCDTVMRLAVRLHSAGHSIEGAASREYIYRWNLALRSPVFGVPHTLGM